MFRRVIDKDVMGRCGTLSIHNHAALKYQSSKIKDTLVTGCAARGYNDSALMDRELTDKILICWGRFLSFPIPKIDLNHPWERHYADQESVLGLE